MKNIGTILLILSLFFMSSCMKGTETDLVNDTAHHNFALNGAHLSPYAYSNIQVYAFKGANQSSMAFNHQVFNMTQTGSVMSMVMPADTWDFVLLSAESGTLGTALVPSIGALRKDAKMWECPSSGGKLLSAPEVITARTGEIVVTPGGHHTADVSMVRNVAMIKIKITEASGFKTNGSHTVSLLNVPKSLTWAGGLYPNKTNPEVSSLPMEATATISDGTGDSQYSNVMTFLVPAHQGSDFMAASPADTTTHKLILQVDLEQQSNNRMTKSVEIPFVPKANKILDISLGVKGQMNVQATVLDWVDETQESNLTRTTLNVSKTNTAFSWRDTVYVETNAQVLTPRVKAGDSWLTATKLDDNRIVFEANTSSYTDGSPRSSYVDIVANNVTKRINVTQRPDEGTISVTPNPFWVSPTTSNTSRTITINSTGPWAVVSGTPPNVLFGSPSGTAGTSSRTLNRLSSTTNMSVYGDADIRIKNTQTLEIVTLKASNLYMEFNDINVGNSPGTNTNTIPNTDAICLGGSGLYTVVSKPSWVTSATVNPDGSLTLVAPGSSDGDSRTGQITFRHNTDPTYQITVPLEQKLVARIPQFDYFTIKFTWSQGSDLDIYAYFTENGVVFDNKKLGYGASGSAGSTVGAYVTKVGGVVQSISNNWTAGLLYWGGDATGQQGEQIFFNAPMVDSDNTLPRKLKFVVECYRLNNNFTVTAQALKHRDGYPATVITHSNYNFNFTNVETVFSKTQTLRTGGAPGTGFRNIVLVYDRLLHDAQIEFYNTP